MTTDSEPRIVTPQEADKWIPITQGEAELAHTVATEPDRIRAAVIEALRAEAHRWIDSREQRALLNRADAIKNGADW